MKFTHKIIIFLILVLNTNCNKNTIISDNINNEIVTNIQLDKTVFKSNEDIKITFSIENKTSKNFKFCYWQTPFENFDNTMSADFFKITHYGKKLNYKGMMFKRIPPTKKDSITINPTKTIKNSIIINKNYDISPKGDYTIQFFSRWINNLPNSNTLTFLVK